MRGKSLAKKKNQQTKCGHCGSKTPKTQIGMSSVEPKKAFCSYRCGRGYDENFKDTLSAADILSAYDSIVECESPFEIATRDGEDRATGLFARIVVNSLRSSVYDSVVVFKNLTDVHAKQIAKKKIPIENFTCYGCAMVKECKYAFDLYNTQGDCLAEK